jgi:hypothetical protein
MHVAPANRPDEGLGLALLRKIKRTAGFVVPLVFLFAERYWFHRGYPSYVASIVNIPGTDLEGPVLADLCLTRVYKVGTTGFTLSSIPIDASTHRSSLLIGAD